MSRSEALAMRGAHAILTVPVDRGPLPTESDGERSETAETAETAQNADDDIENMTAT